MSREPVRVKRVSANLDGRDFIVGDVHGCLKEFSEAMLRVEFNPDVDRLFFVGDLVDRGSASFQCFQLLRYHYAVLGNHEAMAIDSFHFLEGNKNKEQEKGYLTHMMNGGEWIHNSYHDHYEELKRLIEIAENLPHVLVIEGKAYNTVIVHAEVPDHYPEDDLTAAPRIPDRLDDLKNSLLWSRRIFGRMGQPQRTNPYFTSPVVCGHTPDYKIRFRYGHLCIDTGACFGGELTVLDTQDIPKVIHEITEGN